MVAYEGHCVKFPSSTPPRLAEAMELCLQQSASDRPHFKDLFVFLNDLA